MMVHLVALSVFILLFVLSTMRPISMGILAFAAAFIVSLTVTDQPTKEVVAGFPADLFVILVGVTLLFGFAQANGTVALLVDWGVRLIRGRVALIPWLMFVLAAVLCGIGALGPAVLAILFPIGMAFASTHQIRPLLIAMMVGFGCTAGSFSPLGIFGILVNQSLVAADFTINTGSLFLLAFAGGLCAGIVAYFIAGGRDLLRRPVTSSRVDEQTEGALGSGATPVGRGGRPVDGPSGGTQTLTRGSAKPIAAHKIHKRSTSLEQRLTLGALVVLVVGAIGFGLDIGLLAMTLAAVLGLLFSTTIQEATKHISWNVVLLIGGVITYVGVLQEAGTVEWLGEVATRIGSPAAAALVICLIAAAVSAFASTTGMLGALVPLSVPLLQMGEVGILGFAAALSLSASLVDTSPFSTVGAVAIASSPEDERPKVYRSLLRVGLSMIVIAPVTTWAVLVLPGWL